MILLHGMRDVGRSLLPIAEAVAATHYCVMPDLRGHGKSFKPGSYAIQHFLMDLHRLQQHLGVERVSLLGHSLGGHIVCRYAGLYPQRVNELIIVEGLGPPQEEMPRTGELERVAVQLERAVATAAYAVSPRELPSVAVACERLQRNNPRLSAQRALQLAHWGTTAVNADQDDPTQPVSWSFDPRAQEVFLGVSDQRNFDYWQAIQARTLVVTGDLGYQYWQQSFEQPGYSGHTSAEEMRQRLGALGRPDRPAEHLEITGAGHQVHYDQPGQLAAATREFLSRS